MLLLVVLMVVFLVTDNIDNIGFTDGYSKLMIIMIVVDDHNEIFNDDEVNCV